MIYLLTAIGLSPGGSSTVHIYAKKQYTERHKTKKKGVCSHSISYYIASKWWYNWRIVKDLEGNGIGVIEVLYRKLLLETEENHGKLQYTGLLKWLSGFNNLSYTIHLRQEYIVAPMDQEILKVFFYDVRCAVVMHFSACSGEVGTAIEIITADMLQTVWNELDFRVWCL